MAGDRRARGTMPACLEGGRSVFAAGCEFPPVCRYFQHRKFTDYTFQF